MDQDIKQHFAVQSIRIGKIEFEPKVPVVVSLSGIRIIKPDTKEDIVIDIREEDVVKINCYLCDTFCVLLLTTTKECFRSIQEDLKTDNSRQENDNQLILKLNSEFSEALKLLQPIFGSKIIDMDENEYIDAMDRFLERNDPVILVYPPPHIAPRGIQINREDYKLLAVKRPINDVLVDFYLKYLQEEVLTEVQRDRTYIFSQFFYTRLAATQHDKVARWTRNVNLFDKDFIVIPINMNKQWVLAIVCFPYGSLEKDVNAKPCILFFDPLLSDSWDEVATTLRTYLSSEFRAKFGNDYVFNRENLPNYDVDVPEQDNIYDSGLYLLQCAESFFKKPIRNYQCLSTLNQQLENWFDKEDIRTKRQEISFKILQLVQLHNPKILPLPHLNLIASDTSDLCSDSEEDDETEEGEESEESGEDEDNEDKHQIICLDDDEENETEPIEIMDYSEGEE